MIVIEEKICTGCRACEFACSFQQKKSFHYDFSLIRIFKNKAAEGFFTPVLCRHCADAPCAKNCPEEAIRRDHSGAIVKIDPEKCTGCGQCLDSCPWGAPILDPSGGIAKICDLCQGKPLCVTFCNPGALTVAKEGGAPAAAKK